jgi:hypothetical protein
MKNKFSLATMIAMGLVMVSCSTNTDEINSSSQKQNDGMNFKKIDSVTKPPLTIYTTEDGTLPPIKPKE